MWFVFASNSNVLHAFAWHARPHMLVRLKNCCKWRCEVTPYTFYEFLPSCIFLPNLQKHLSGEMMPRRDLISLEVFLEFSFDSTTQFYFFHYHSCKFSALCNVHGMFILFTLLSIFYYFLLTTSCEVSTFNFFVWTIIFCMKQIYMILHILDFLPAICWCITGNWPHFPVYLNS